MKLGKIRRNIFKLKRVLRSKKYDWREDAKREVREVARLGQRLVIMELR